MKKYDIEKIKTFDFYDEIAKQFLTKEEIDKNERDAINKAKFLKKTKLINIEKKR